MPCLELKAALQRAPEPASRLRSLLEKTGAAVLRRNHLADAPGHDDALLRERLRVTAVLAVDLTDPPREQEADPEAPAESEAPASEPPADETHEPLAGNFAKGIEIWIADGPQYLCVHADSDEIAGALAMFDAYLRLARYQPAFHRLEQRIVGLSYTFREGLRIGVHGEPAEGSASATLESAAAIPEIHDVRESAFFARFSTTGIGYFHDLLRSAAAWLDENSYPNILGSK